MFTSPPRWPLSSYRLWLHHHNGVGNDLDARRESLVGPATLARLTARAEQMMLGVTDCEAWPAPRSQLVMIGLDGTDPYAALQRAES